MSRWTVQDTPRLLWNLVDTCTWRFWVDTRGKNTAVERYLIFCTRVIGSSRWAFLPKPSDLWRGGGFVWSHRHPRKAKAPACFCFWTRFLLFWLACMCANNKNELMLHINEVIRQTHKSPLFEGEGSRLISWLSFLQIRGHIWKFDSLFSIKRGLHNILFCSIFQNPLALLWLRNIRIWG